MAVHDINDWLDLGSFKDGGSEFDKILESNIKTMQAFGKELDKAQKKHKEISDAFSANLQNLASLGSQTAISKNITILQKEIGNVLKTLNNLVAEIQPLNKGIKFLSDSIATLTTNFQGVSNAYNTVNQKTQQTAKSFLHASGSINELKQKLKEAKDAYNELGTAASDIEKQHYKDTIKALTKELTKLEQASKDAEKAGKDEAKQANSTANAYDDLSKHLNSIRKEYKGLLAEQAKGIPLSLEQQKRLAALSIEVETLDKALKDIDAKAGQFQRNVGNYSSALGGIFENLTGVGLAGGVAGIGASLGSMFAEEFIGSIRESVTIVKDISKEVNAQLYGIATNIDDITASGVALSSVFKTDATNTVNGLTAAINVFGEDSQKAFELVSYGLATSGLQGDEFLEALNEYSQTFKGLGFTAEESINIFSNFAKVGARNIDRIGDIINNAKIELERFGNDPAVKDLLGAAFVDNISKKMESGVLQGKEALRLYAKEIERIGINSANGAEAITKLFTAVGEESVEVGRLIRSLINGQLEEKRVLSESQKAQIALASQTKETSERVVALMKAFGNGGTTLQIFGEKLKQYVLDYVIFLIDYYKDFYNQIKSVFSEIMNLGDAFSVLGDNTTTFTDILTFLSETVGAFYKFSVQAFVNILKYVTAFFHGVGAGVVAFRKNSKDLEEAINDYILQPFEDIKKEFDDLVELFTEDLPAGFKQFANDVKKFFEPITTYFYNFANDIAISLRDLLSPLDSLFTPVLNAFEDFANMLTAFIEPFEKTFGKPVVESIKGFAKGFSDSLDRMDKSIEKSREKTKELTQTQLLALRGFNELTDGSRDLNESLSTSEIDIFLGALGELQAKASKVISKEDLEKYRKSLQETGGITVEMFAQLERALAVGSGKSAKNLLDASKAAKETEKALQALNNEIVILAANRDKLFIESNLNDIEAALANEENTIIERIRLNESLYEEKKRLFSLEMELRKKQIDFEAKSEIKQLENESKANAKNIQLVTTNKQKIKLIEEKSTLEKEIINEESNQKLRELERERYENEKKYTKESIQLSEERAKAVIQKEFEINRVKENSNDANIEEMKEILYKESETATLFDKRKVESIEDAALLETEILAKQYKQRNEDITMSYKEQYEAAKGNSVLQAQITEQANLELKESYLQYLRDTVKAEKATAEQIQAIRQERREYIISQFSTFIDTIEARQDARFEARQDAALSLLEKQKQMIEESGRTEIEKTKEKEKIERRIIQMQEQAEARRRRNEIKRLLIAQAFSYLANPKEFDFRKSGVSALQGVLSNLPSFDSGGFTASNPENTIIDRKGLKVAGIVHKNEFVANEKALKNPFVRNIANDIDKAQKTNNFSFFEQRYKPLLETPKNPLFLQERIKEYTTKPHKENDTSIEAIFRENQKFLSKELRSVAKSIEESTIQTHNTIIETIIESRKTSTRIQQPNNRTNAKWGGV